MSGNKGSRVLVTGATGYVGSRIVPKLLEKGYAVRVLVRNPQRLDRRPWLNEVEVVVGDVLQPDTLPPALERMDFVYYLIHSMANVDDFCTGDLEAAENMGKAAKAAGVERVIYLGGLGDPKTNLSTHLRSRHLTGDQLRASGAPITEFRAGIIIGSGSASFEMIRYLTERLPIIITPRWVYTKGQPIAIRDVLDYLVASLRMQNGEGKTIEIGGPDILSYAEMMLGYAAFRGLRRYLIPVPVLTPLLTSRVHWMTPVPAGIARALTQGLKNEVVVRKPLAKQLFPEIKPIDYKSAVQIALNDLRPENFEDNRRNPSSAPMPGRVSVRHRNIRGMITETRQLKVKAPPETVYQTFTSLGGKNGWLFADGLWQLRGILDQVVGGVGLRRGRRHPTQIRVGDPFDFYRVEAVEPNTMMRLRAEMKLPGEAWMQYTVRSIDGNSSQLTQTAYFAPKGLFGHLYWYLLYPFHTIVFSGLIRALGSKAETIQETIQGSSRVNKDQPHTLHDS